MKEGNNKQFWQRVAKVYAPFMGSAAPLYTAICERIRPQLTREMDVLELACGTGQLSYPLSRFVRLWEATDFSEAMITEAKRQNRSARLRFSVQDATALPYGAETFDAVVISNALHIMPDPEQVMREIDRVLKPGGLLFAPTFVHGESMGFRLRTRLMGLAGFRTYHKWSTEEFLAFVARHSFEVVERDVLGSRIAPLCYVAARKGSPEWSAQKAKGEKGGSPS